jgi:hypothetical protein
VLLAEDLPAGGVEVIAARRHHGDCSAGDERETGLQAPADRCSHQRDADLADIGQAECDGRGQAAFEAVEHVEGQADAAGRYGNGDEGKPGRPLRPAGQGSMLFHG